MADDGDIKRLKISLKLNEWLNVEVGGRECRLRLVGFDGSNGRFEIDGPLAFQFTRESYLAKGKAVMP